MSTIQKLSVALTGEQVDALKAAVDSGEYATTSEIVREAIRDWQLKYGLRREEIVRLRRLWDDGEASGEPRPVDLAKLRTEARKRLKRTGGPSSGAG
jgi:antitoxin ParD1/3/4